MNPGTVYPLAAQTSLVFGDVQGAFTFVGGAPDTAGDSSVASGRPLRSKVSA
jgi:hypothetical protein